MYNVLSTAFLSTDDVIGYLFFVLLSRIFLETDMPEYGFLGLSYLGFADLLRCVY